MRERAGVWVSIGLFCMSFPTLVVADIERRTANNGDILMEDIPVIPQSLIDDLNRYQNVRTATLADWMQDGKSIYIATRFADVNQIHRVDMQGGARYQLTFGKEPVRAISRQHKGHLLAYTMDAGGNENSQIYIFDPVINQTVMLSDGYSQNAHVRWSPDDQYVAYTSTQRNGASNDIWMASVDKTSAPRLLLEATDGALWSAVDWSANGKYLLVQQYVSAADSSVYVLAVDTGEKVLLRGGTAAPSVNKPVAFDRTDQGYFFLSNADGEYEQLFYVKRDGTGLKNITADIAWDIDAVALSQDGRRGAFVVNENGIGRLYLFDPDGFRYRLVSAVTAGVIANMRFNPNATQLAITLSSAQTPSDVFTLALKSSVLKYGDFRRWTFSETGGLDTRKFISPVLMHYSTFDQVNGQPRQIPAYVYKPASAKPCPVVIVIHGGPEAQFRPTFSSGTQLWLDKLGVAVIAPNVRGSTGYGRQYVGLDNGFKREDSVKDIGALLDWILTQPDLDANRVAVMGGSYGGYMTLASAVHYSQRLRAAVDVVGISNFVTFLESTKEYRRDLRRVEYGDEREPVMRRFLEEISPARHVDSIEIPMLIIQGQNDPRVPVTESEQMVRALRDKGRQVWYMNALNEGHGYSKKANQDIYQQAVVLFLKKYLLEP